MSCETVKTKGIINTCSARSRDEEDKRWLFTRWGWGWGGVDILKSREKENIGSDYCVPTLCWTILADSSIFKMFALLLCELEKRHLSLSPYILTDAQEVVK